MIYFFSFLIKKKTYAQPQNIRGALCILTHEGKKFRLVVLRLFNIGDVFIFYCRNLKTYVEIADSYPRPTHPQNFAGDPEKHKKVPDPEKVGNPRIPRILGTPRNPGFCPESARTRKNTKKTGKKRGPAGGSRQNGNSWRADLVFFGFFTRGYTGKKTKK
jgi:hypothetical protein